MSMSMSRVTGSPVGSFRPGRAPGIGETLRSLLSLLLIEIRRSQGYWLLPLMVGLGVFMMSQNRGGDGVVLWPDLSTSTMQSYVIVGPLAAALAAWIVDRDRRRRVQGLVGTMATSPFRRDLIHVATAAFWGLLGYGLIAAWYGFQGVTEATWGGPDVQLIATGAIAIVILAAVGFIVGRIVRGKFSPIIAVGVAFFVAAAPDFIQELTRNHNEVYSDLAIRPLSPWGLIANRGPDIYYRIPSGYLLSALLWLTGAAAVVLVVIALLRHWRRNWTAWVALAASCVVALVGANRVMGYNGGYGYASEDEGRIPFTWSCETTETVEVCVHPAYEAKLDESAWRINAFVAPVAGLPGVPTRWEQGSPFNSDRGKVGTFHPGNQLSYTFDLGQAFFPFTEEHHDFTAAESVILTWLSSRVDPENSNAGMFIYPAELMGTPRFDSEGMMQGFDIDPEAEAFYARGIPAAADRFAALSPDAQRAWLETNWDALRAGKLTLDQMP